jgi:argininosuccinate lyase
MPNKQLWSGRFKHALSETALRFSSSIDIDKDLYKEDIQGSIAHVEMLAACKIITGEESRRIRSALHSIEKEIELGKLDLSWKKEDIHMAIESRLIEKIGALGGKLHTGRSRNDQIALDERLYLRKAIVELKKLLTHFQRVLLFKSEKYFGTLMPGYTHLQRAQPIYLSHHLLAYVSMFERDFERLDDCYYRINKLPLGAAALAGTSFPIDRNHVAKKLGFNGIIENSIDAVSDRDYIIEFISVCANIMMHASRFAEELVLWSSQEFSFAKTDDTYTTGSSIMPQKKNPDMAELVRGKTGRVYGDLMNILVLMKGLPLSYNRDMQEDKLPLFDTVKTTKECVNILSNVVVHTKFEKQRFEEELKNDFLTATEIADFLVTKHVPFRDAHEITGKIVSYCIEHHTSVSKLTLKELHHFSQIFNDDIFELLDPHKSIAHKKSAGSTSPNEVKKQIVHWIRTLKHRKFN